MKLRRQWARLSRAALTGLPLLMAPVAIVPVLPADDAQTASLLPARLDALREAALTGDFKAVRSYWHADLQAHWPQLARRIVILQGDEPQPTSFDDFYAGYRNARQDGQAPDLPSPVMLATALKYYTWVRQDNTDNRPVTYNNMGEGQLPVAIVGIPAGRCTSCSVRLMPADEKSCQPVHPDTLYYQGMTRLQMLYHEQAHALRVVQGLFRFETGSEQHLEEVIAELYSDARLIQSYGDRARGFIERSLRRDPVERGKSRLYIAHVGRMEQLDWLRQQGEALAAMPPQLLLDQATAIAARTVLSESDLETVRRFEEQVPFVGMGSRRRQELAAAAPAAAGEDVRDGSSCRWNYPPLLRQLDAQAQAITLPETATLAGILKNNPLRPDILREAGPFALNRDDPAQVEALMAFNRSVRPAACSPLDAETVRRADLWLPVGKSAPLAPDKEKMCPS